MVRSTDIDICQATLGKSIRHTALIQNLLLQLCLLTWLSFFRRIFVTVTSSSTCILDLCLFILISWLSLCVNLYALTFWWPALASDRLFVSLRLMLWVLTGTLRIRICIFFPPSVNLLVTPYLGLWLFLDAVTGVWWGGRSGGREALYGLEILLLIKLWGLLH